KLREGTQGIGVMLIESDKAARSVIAAFRQIDADILVQEFIADAEGADYRALVVGGEVIAAMRRQAAAGDFRANLHQGGSAACGPLSRPPPPRARRPPRPRPPADERALACHAARAVGLHVAGVDFLRSRRGPLVIEVNASPGLEGIETATGIDVAGAIIQFIE